MPSTRRRFLGATAGTTAALVSLAGCTGSDGNPPDRPVVERVGLRNHDDTAHRVALHVEVDGTVEHWTSYDLAPAGEDGGAATIEPPAFPAEEAIWAVGVRLLDGDAQTTVDPRVHDHTCKVLTFRVTDDADIEPASTSHECDGGGE
ncbi:hypothetical protein [Halobacterium litoreum]|uniref:Tat (Twin-arginine translocation) pathway signal sequence n=1 Tax=Halobacterium litoreum TaxID=2039234 RepID=A0ABD5NCT9_9EURY|nr:hypothetical protein [Halobacterium litoreum]UHH14152.1 hypothetical protein LT972_03920 [Halobacterium litoreum]